MKISPIIHTRLYNCDYSLVVKPTGITNELEFVKKHIFYSNKSMDFLEGERWVVIDNGGHRIAGLVGFLNKICSNCNLSEDLKNKSEKLFRDSKGRSIYGFIGIVIKDFVNSDKSIVPTYDYLLKLFIENISPIFDSPIPKTIEKEFGFAEYNVNSILSSDKSFDIPKESKKFGDKKIFVSTSKNDYELFKHFLNSRERNFAFCSNISKIGDIPESIFSVMTTKQNCFNELERAEEEARKKAEAEANRKAEEEAKRKAEEEAKRKVEEEERRKVEEEVRKKAEAEAKRKAEEEAKRKAEEEAKKKAEEEERKAEEEERRRKAEKEAKRKAEEEARRRAEEEERREEELRRRREEAEEAEERRKRQERKRKQEEERRREEESRKFREEEKLNNKGNSGCMPSFLLIIGGIGLLIGGIIYYFFKEG